MSSYGKHKGKHGKFTFIQIRHDVFDSAAYQSLSLPARCALHEIMRHYNGFNNGEIPMSVREIAEKIRSGKSTVSHAVHELIERGFIVITKNSGFNMKSGRRARRFGLTFLHLDKAHDQKTPPTHEWKKWSPN